MAGVLILPIFYSSFSYAASQITSYVQLNPPGGTQPGGFNTQSGTVGTFTDTGLPPNQCVQTGAGGLLITTGLQCGSSSGSGGSSLQVTLNGVQISSPTSSMNFSNSGFSLGAIGSTATIALNPNVTVEGALLTQNNGWSGTNTWNNPSIYNNSITVFSSVTAQNIGLTNGIKAGNLSGLSSQCLQADIFGNVTGTAQACAPIISTAGFVTNPGTNLWVNNFGINTSSLTLGNAIIDSNTGYKIFNVNGTGASNVFIGANTATSPGSGLGNTGVGSYEFENLTTGADNTAGGTSSLQNATSASYDTTFGVGSLGAITNGAWDSAFGYDAGYNTSTGNGVVTGSSDTFIGAYSGTSNSSLINATAIGVSAVVNTNNTMQLGNSVNVLASSITLQSGGLRFADGTYQTTAGSGGGGSSALAVNVNSVQISSPTSSIGFNGTGVTSSNSGSSTTVNLNMIANQSTLQSGATFYVSSGTVANQLNVNNITISGTCTGSGCGTGGGSGIVSPGTFTWTNNFGFLASTITVSTITVTNAVQLNGTGNLSFVNQPDGKTYQIIGSSITSCTAGQTWVVGSSNTAVCVTSSGGGGGTPATPNWSVQIDSNGAFGGIPYFTADASSITIVASSQTYSGFDTFNATGVNFNLLTSTITVSSQTVAGQFITTGNTTIGNGSAQVFIPNLGNGIAPFRLVEISSTIGGNPLVSGGLVASDIPPGSGNYIQNSSTLQSGSTFYTSSGTVTSQLNVGGSINNIPSGVFSSSNSFGNNFSSETISIRNLSNGGFSSLGGGIGFYTQNLSLVNVKTSQIYDAQSNGTAGNEGGKLILQAMHGSSFAAPSRLTLYGANSSNLAEVRINSPLVPESGSTLNIFDSNNSGTVNLQFGNNSGNGNISWVYPYFSTDSPWVFTSSITVIGKTSSPYEATFSSSAATYNVAITTNGFVVSNGSSPSMGTCGSSPSVIGDDWAGVITVGSGVVTSCAMNFSVTHTGCTMSCIESDNSTAVTGDITSLTTSSVTFGFSATLGGGIIYYNCHGYGASCK